MINDPVKIRSFENAVKKHGFHTERSYDRDIGITIMFIGPHKNMKKNVLRLVSENGFNHLTKKEKT